MIEHKAYECEFCGKEFDNDEREEALRHEVECDCNPVLKRCGACKYGKQVISYECEYIQCTKLRPMDGTCESWLNK